MKKHLIALLFLSGSFLYSNAQNSYLENTNKENEEFLQELNLFETGKSNSEILKSKIISANTYDKGVLFKTFDINDFNSFDKSYTLIKQIEERNALLNLVDNEDLYINTKNSLAKIFELVSDNLLQNNNVIDARVAYVNLLKLQFLQPKNQKVLSKINKSIEIGKVTYYVNIKSPNKLLVKKSLLESNNPMISYVFSPTEKHDETLDLKYNFYRKRKEFTAFFWGDRDPINDYDFNRKNYSISKQSLNNESVFKPNTKLGVTKEYENIIGFKSINEIRDEFINVPKLNYLISVQPYLVKIDLVSDSMNKKSFELNYEKEQILDVSNVDKFVWLDLELTEQEIANLFAEDLNRLLVKNFK